MLLKLHTFRLLFVVLFISTGIKSSKLEKGFEALRVYDYFQAKKLFLEQNKKNTNSFAAYGLAIIFSRNDNPFSNSDSAGKYIRQSYHSYLLKPEPQTLSGFLINAQTILALADTISQHMFQKVKQVNTISAYHFFLTHFTLASRKICQDAVYRRDDLEFNHVLEQNTSDSTRAFMITHPLSSFYVEAALLLDRQLYDETTASGQAAAYVSFLAQYPKNVLVNTAHEKLFAIYRQQKDIAGLASFVKNYPQAPQNLEAWKLLFSLSVKEFSFEELKRFVAVYPDFPLKTSILKELELNKLQLYPYQQGDYKGFIDETGKFVIKPIYDEASDFFEGLSVVSKNDSVYFVNKQNVDPFHKVYSDALVFRNGIAPVKQAGKWCFINRQGQTISKQYDEINELSDNVYVVKAGDKYGALDHFGQTILEPRFDKLGDFKNGFAYYLEKGNYGFVSRSGTLRKAEFEWISDFNSEHIAIIQQNNKYGLITASGKRLLEPQYDQILKTNSPVFMVIQAGQYGFFSSEGCFLTPVAYDYVKEYPVEFYTNGALFKLLKKKEQAFVDANGRVNINFGAYQEVHFAGNDLIRVKQKNKYGYVDRKLNLVIPYKYQQAEDFSDSLALVKFKDNTILINTEGREVFSTGAEMQRVLVHYFMVNDDARSIVNHKGELVYTEVDNVQKISSKLLIVSLNNGEIKLLYD